MRKPTPRFTRHSSNDEVAIYAQKLDLFDYDKIYEMRMATQAKVPVEPDEDNNVIMTNPYKPGQLISYEHAWRFDPIVRLAVNKKVDFIIGERPVTVLDTIKEFTGDPEAANQAFNNIVGNNMYQEMKSWIDNLNTKLKWHEKFKSATVNMKTYGRSALHVEKLLDIEPIDLKLLNSQKLGDVYVKNDTWKLSAVRYNNTKGKPSENDDLLEANELIYFPNLNHNVTPDTYWYGYSEIEPIVHVSELNRIMDMTDFKEINAKMWGGYGIIKFLEAKDEVSMAQWLSKFKPGTWMATDSNVEVAVHELKNSMKELIEQRESNDLRILRAIGIPSFLGGYEKITNRATVRSILEAWKVSTLIPERTMLKNIVEPQWYDTLVAHYLGERDIKSVMVKVKQEFKDIVFENVKDLVESYLPLFEQGMINAYQFLRLLDLEYLADETKALQNKMLQQVEQLKQEISLGIDQKLGRAPGSKTDMEQSIMQKIIKDNLLEDIEAKMQEMVTASIDDFARNAALKKIAKEKLDWAVSDEELGLK